jgi:predicted transposase/invertase (TIGR01784 family)
VRDFRWPKHTRNDALLAEDLAAPITDVDILNPYNERETLDDKLTVVDVKARDAARRIFQIEIQLVVFANLAPRILYTWADLFSQQLQSGEDYRVLQPVYAIWILDATLFRDRPEYAHRYRWRDDHGRSLADHGTIRVFELSKFDVEPVQSDAERWLKFLKDGASLDPTRLPAWMQPPIMRSAMSTLNAFSEKERDYHRYQSRQEALRVQRAVAQELEERRAAEQAALQAAEAERQRPRSKPRRPHSKTRRPRSKTRRPRSKGQGRGPRRDRPPQGASGPAGEELTQASHVTLESRRRRRGRRSTSPCRHRCPEGDRLRWRVFARASLLPARLGRQGLLFPILIRKPPAISAGSIPPVMSFSGEGMG